MPREIITVQVGQCGNQIGSRFWDVILKEHVQYNPDGVFNEPLSSFFYNCDPKTGQEIPIGGGTCKIRGLKARSVLIDSEEGVLSHVLRSKLGDLFSGGHFIKDSSGAGNNWAVGYNEYGPKHHEALLDEFHSAAEKCDSLQSFFMMHSLGGGTGSGLGSYVLEMLADHFPSVYRFTTSVFPQEDDDVVTSPYNSVLALDKLIEHAHCVLPFDNQALIRISEEVHRAGGGSSVLKGGTHTKRASFDPLNNIVAHALTNLTASMRFDGLLNVDINEITTNLVPFPRLHFLLSSLAPMSHSSKSSAATAATMASAAVDPLFSSAIKQSNQLLCCDPRTGTTLAAAALVRGAVPLSDVSRNMVRLRPSLRMVSWNPDGFKLGLCERPPVGMPCSLMLVTNNTAVRSVFDASLARFDKIWSRRSWAHHYTDKMPAAAIEEARESVLGVSLEYRSLEQPKAQGGSARLAPLA